MILHPLDPDGGYLVRQENHHSLIVSLSDGLFIHGHIVNWTHIDKNPHILISYAYREIVSHLTEDCQISHDKRWIITPSIGTIPLHPNENLPLGERFRRSLADSFGRDAQARLNAVKMLARLRQDAVGWGDTNLIINHQYPRGILRTQSQIGKKPLSTVLLKSSRGRKPPDLDAFLGPACELSSISHERSRILHRPEFPAPQAPTGHSRIHAILNLFAVFAQYGIDLSPWEDDLIP